MSRKKSLTTEQLGRKIARDVKRMSEEEKAEVRKHLDRELGPAKFKTEVKRLIEQDQMPTLDQLLNAIAEAREIYQPKILSARKKAGK
jgi:hypothetical protein